MTHLVRFLRIFALMLLPFISCGDWLSYDDPCEGVNCDDRNPCTRDHCVGGECEAAHCVHDPVKDGTNCSIRGASGVCMGGVCDLCVGVVCEDDGNPCTRDVCDPNTGRCGVPAADGTACKYKGLFSGVCVSGFCAKNLCEDGVCDDGNECTDDMCDSVAGRCKYIPLEDYTECDFDGLAGLCIDGVCKGDLCEGVACDDQNACTADTCNDADGTCDFIAVEDGTACRDGEGACQAGECLGQLLWPIDCVPGETCDAHVGYPDIDKDGQAFDCVSPVHTWRGGTGIGITWAQMDAGMDVRAAAPGRVIWVFDGKYDRCPNPDEPDCQPRPSPESPEGYAVCTEPGDYCGQGTCCCYWCFAGGNVVVIRHVDVQGVFATRYDHLKKGSVVVTDGEFVGQGQKIAEVGSAGNSSGPHLYFEVWGTGFYELADPWAGPCGSNLSDPLWALDPPWAQQEPGGQ